MWSDRQQALEATLARTGSDEKVLLASIEAGIADPEVLKEMLRQRTEQEYAQTSDAMVQSRSEAQTASNRVDLVREEQDPERAHQSQIRHGNQSTPAASGASTAASCPSCRTPTRPEWNTCPSCGTSLATSTATAKCGGCGNEIQSDWKACPACGIPLAEVAAKCANCQAEVQPGWKACPACGSSL